MKKQSTIIISFILTTVIILGCTSKDNKATIVDKTTVASEQDSVHWIIADNEFATEQLVKFTTDPSEKLFIEKKVLITNQQDLISITEPILFRIFGKQSIMKDRPYQIALIGNFWIMTGTVHTDKGGSFCIAIDRNTCEVKGITHWK